MPPPADAEVSLAQLVPLLLEPDDELDEQPAASSVAAAATPTPTSANRYDDLNSAS
jgi:hypothetical protein